MKKILIIFILISIFMMTTVSAKLDVLNVACEPENKLTYEQIDMDRDLGSYLDLVSTEDLDNVDISVNIKGYEYEKIEDSTHLFDMKANAKYRKYFSVRLPDNMNPGNYKLRFNILAKNVSESCYINYQIVHKRKDMKIEDVSIGPSTTIKAGEAFSIQSLIRNIGQKDQKLVKVTAEIVKLSISNTDYYHNITTGKSSYFERYLNIPSCTEAGQYDVKITVEYDEAHKKVIKEVPITVTQGSCVAPAPKVNGDESPVVLKTLSEQELKLMMANINVENPNNPTDGIIKKSISQYVLPATLVFVIVVLVIIGVVILMRRK